MPVAGRQENPYQWWTPGPNDAGYSDYIAQAQPTPTQQVVSDWFTDPSEYTTTWEQQVVTTSVATYTPAETTSLLTPDIPVASTSQLPPIELDTPSLVETSSSALPTSTRLLAAITTSIVSLSSSSIPPSSSTQESSVFSTGFLGKIALPTQSLTSSPSDQSDSSFVGFFQRLGKSPVYIALTCLVGLVILVLIVALLAFCIRRRSHRKQRERKFSAVWDEQADGGADAEKSGNAWIGAPPVLIDEQGTMSPAMYDRLSRMSQREMVERPDMVHVPSQTNQSTWYSTTSKMVEEQDRYTPLPPRAGLRPISGYSAQESFMQPPLHPWSSASSLHQSREVAPEDQPSRFSSFSTGPIQAPSPAYGRPQANNQLQIPRGPSRLGRQMSKASTSGSIWSTSTGSSDAYETSLADFTPSAGSIGRRASLSSLSSFQSGRVSNFRRKLSLATTSAGSARLQRHRASWELLEEEEEVANKKAQTLIRARMRRTGSENSANTTLVGEAMTVGRGKGY